MTPKTADTGGTGKAFPTTRWSVIRGASDPESPVYRESLETLAGTYWRPVYAHFRKKWRKPHEDARDLTQDFFAALCEKDFLSRLSPDAGRFRSYIMTALDNFARLDHRVRSRKKRGGAVAILPLDRIEGFEPATEPSAETVFQMEWARSILSGALEEMGKEYRAAGKEKLFELFVLHDIDPPGGEPPAYRDLAARFGVPVTDVTNALFRGRKRMRELALKRVRDTVTTEDEAESELRELFDERRLG